MVDEEVRCPICQAVADPLGDHQVGCGGNGDRIVRHDSLRDALFSAAQYAALVPRREVPSLIPGSKSRPADLNLPHWSQGRPAALDVTVISTMQALTVTGAATTPLPKILYLSVERQCLHVDKALSHQPSGGGWGRLNI